MTTVRAKPVLHGRDHCPDGPDPIPCLTGLGAVGDFNTAVLSITDLLAYWRLGEPSTPWADTSGVGTPANLTERTEATGGAYLSPTYDVTGALPAGQDDGAVEFNYDGVVNTGGRYLGNLGASKSFALTELTVAAWVKVKASSLTRRGHIVGNMHVDVVGNNRNGWALQVMYPARTVRFTIGGGPTSGSEQYAETTGGVVAGEWNLFVGTVASGTIRLYANGALVATTTGAGTPSTASTEVTVGMAYSDYASFNYIPAWLYGTIDEAAVWTRALTAAEVATLYAAGTGASSDAGGDPAADAQVWMPLTTVVGSVPELVWGSSNNLIPTLTPI